MKKGLNKQAILELADDLIAHKQRYSQNVFGRVEECGTVACLAGFCCLREIGTKKYKKLIKADDDSLEEACLESGKRILGIKTSLSMPVIFSGASDWPEDLYDEYMENGPKGRVITALKALQRLKPDGTIDHDPDKVHTKIPQLEALLKKK